VFTAVLDTCVLFPMYLRDTLLRLATAGLYQPIWSARILTELQGALIRNGISAAGAERIVHQMRTYFPSAEATCYEPLIVSMTCDQKDRHVLAAAVKVGAGALVTQNRSDFPPQSVAAFEIEVLSPDEFLLDLLDLSPHTVLSTLAAQADRYKREPKTVHGLLGALERSGTPGFADEVRRHLDQ
jgi:predicted nucleic acid-binding protein